MSTSAHKSGSLSDSTYHYPPELLELLSDAIPLLFRSKQAVIDFFRGAGVPQRILSDWQTRLKADRDAVKKHEMVRSVLRSLNEGGDGTLRHRREVLKRVCEFEDYSSCWDGDRLKAQGLVARINHVVNVKDSFTKMNVEREKERSARQAEHLAAMHVKQLKRQGRETIRISLNRLFAEQNPQKRGKALEKILNELFASYDILIREAFVLVGQDGEGIVEQIDGAIELEGHVYLVEIKWHNQPIGKPEISPHLVSVFGRAEARGIFISVLGYTEPAKTVVREALSQKVYILCELQEILMALERETDLKDVLRHKVRAAISEKQPYASYPW
jgi:restriction system protein